jgi:hypothetical protein
MYRILYSCVKFGLGDEVGADIAIKDKKLADQLVKDGYIKAIAAK